MCVWAGGLTLFSVRYREKSKVLVLYESSGHEISCGFLLRFSIGPSQDSCRSSILLAQQHDSVELHSAEPLTGDSWCRF